MGTKGHPTIPLGVGIYYPAEAANFLQLPAHKVSRWARGYTFWRDAGRSRRGLSDPVISSDLPRIGKVEALSFLELMELRAVAALRLKGLSLQYIRAAGRIARKQTGSKHPFAQQKVYTDGRRIFMGLDPHADDPDMIELTRRKDHQILLGSVMVQLLDQLDFTQDTGLARRWWPMGKNVPVVLDPRIAFGAPVVEGTRTQTYVVAGLVSRSTASEAAEAYDIPLPGVQAAVAFEAQLRRAA